MKRNLFKYLPASLLIVVLTTLLQQPLSAQNETDELHIVQLSGMVMNADSTEVIPFVNIFDPKRGRGTSSNYLGWFSKPFLAGDSVVFSAIGYKRKQIIVPDTVGDRITVVVNLEEDVTQLPDVEINPFPTEEIFKEAIMAMNLTQEQENVLQSFDPALVQDLVQNLPIEGSAALNYRYLMNQQFYNLQNSAGPRTNPLLNPFAWAQFINSFKKKKKKR